MQLGILNGIYADNTPSLRTSYPVNLMPVPKGSGVSQGYLCPASGIVAFGAGPGVDRGGINYYGTCYRVMGSKLISVYSDGTISILGDVEIGTDPYVTLDYGFGVLMIVSNNCLFYWNGTTLTKVTDRDLGFVLDALWVDGYFMTTDGTNIVVTELSDPTQVNPLKYGAAEIDPDPIKALLKVRSEVYVLGRHTIEVFDNVGGDLFPFARVEGAHVMKGTVGTHACCVFMQSLVFLGSGRNEQPSIYVISDASAQKIATDEVDKLLAQYTEEQLAQVKLETITKNIHELLYVHLPDRTLVFDGFASKALGSSVWFVVTSTLDGFEQYRARNMVWAYNKWIVGDPQSSNIGVLSDDVGTHWGNKVRWEFGTQIVYNESKGAIFNELELVSLTGSVAQGKNPLISTSYSLDGQTWSMDRFIQSGSTGNRNKRLVWYQQGSMRNRRMQRFRGDSDSHLSFLCLEAQIEPLAY